MAKRGGLFPDDETYSRDDYYEMLTRQKKRKLAEPDRVKTVAPGVRTTTNHTVSTSPSVHVHVEQRGDLSDLSFRVPPLMIQLITFTCIMMTIGGFIAGFAVQSVQVIVLSPVFSALFGVCSLVYLFVGWIFSYIYYKLYWWLAALGWLVLTLAVIMMVMTAIGFMDVISQF